MHIYCQYGSTCLYSSQRQTSKTHSLQRLKLKRHTSTARPRSKNKMTHQQEYNKSSTPSIIHCFFCNCVRFSEIPQKAQCSNVLFLTAKHEISLTQGSREWHPQWWRMPFADYTIRIRQQHMISWDAVLSNTLVSLSVDTSETLCPLTKRQACYFDIRWTSMVSRWKKSWIHNKKKTCLIFSRNNSGRVPKWFIFIYLLHSR